MSGEICQFTQRYVTIQDNDLIYDEATGHSIGRIENAYNQTKEFPSTHVVYTIDEMEHTLNCFDNLFYIHEQPEETQKEWLEIIHKACHEARQKWLKAVRNSISE